jgi:beta-glucanase (GH16 family)
LILTAKKVKDNQTIGSYTSTRMITKGKKEFTYGKMEIRAKLPSGRGIWPAIWMLGANFESAGWPACGEIDIMEYVGYEPNTVHSTVHTLAGYGAGGNGSSKTLETAEEEFHVYGLIWTEKEMVFYTDSLENITHRYAPANKTEENWPFDKAQFFRFLWEWLRHGIRQW